MEQIRCVELRLLVRDGDQENAAAYEVVARVIVPAMSPARTLARLPELVQPLVTAVIEGIEDRLLELRD